MADKQHYKTVLTIAGSDSIGGAGIEADIKTCTTTGTYAMAAITAVTAQNTMGVQSYEAVSPALLRAQLDSVIADVRPDAVKIGMVPTVEHVRVIADWIRANDISPVVLDPVCVATSGDALAADSVPAALRNELMPLATVVTPNLPEARLLTRVDFAVDPDDNSQMDDAVMVMMQETGVPVVVVKGGHDSGDMSVDYVYYADQDEVGLLCAPRVDSVNTHGTGCTFSSAIASYLAQGHSVAQALHLAKAYITAAIAHGADYAFGHGHGPVRHGYYEVK